MSESTITGLGGSVEVRYTDGIPETITFEGSFNREVCITLPDGQMLFVSAIDLQRVVNVATWCAEVDSWGDPDPEFLKVHPGPGATGGSSGYPIGTRVVIVAGRYRGLHGKVSMLDPTGHEHVAVLLEQGVGHDGVFYAGNVPVTVSELRLAGGPEPEPEG